MGRYMSSEPDSSTVVPPMAAAPVAPAPPAASPTDPLRNELYRFGFTLIGAAIVSFVGAYWAVSAKVERLEVRIEYLQKSSEEAAATNKKMSEQLAGITADLNWLKRVLDSLENRRGTLDK